jgi:hypothetical protein
LTSGITIVQISAYLENRVEGKGREWIPIVTTVSSIRIRSVDICKTRPLFEVVARAKQERAVL